MIEILEQEKGNATNAVKRIHKELGLQRSGPGLLDWINNVVLRGHTKYKNKGDIKYNTHPDAVLLTEQRYRQIQLLLNDRRRMRGVNGNRLPAPLSGLCYCSCGYACSMQRQRGHSPRIRCQISKATAGKYNHIGTTSILYQPIEDQVIEQMVKFADAIAADALNALDKESKPNPKILELEEEIEYLREGIKRFGDNNGDKAARVAILQSEIGQLAAIPISQVISDELMAELAKLSNIEIWRKVSNDARRDFFLAFLDRVTIDFASKTATIHLSRNVGFSRPDKGQDYI
jgi:hypothetical protein